MHLVPYVFVSVVFADFARTTTCGPYETKLTPQDGVSNTAHKLISMSCRANCLFPCQGLSSAVERLRPGQAGTTLVRFQGELASPNRKGACHPSKPVSVPTGNRAVSDSPSLRRARSRDASSRRHPRVREGVPQAKNAPESLRANPCSSGLFRTRVPVFLKDRVVL